MGKKACLLVSGGVAGVVVVILVVALVSSSFQYIEWNEIAFKKDTTKNEVDSTAVYQSGRYFWGLGYTPFTFPKGYITINFTPTGLGALTIFTQAALSVSIECSLQYKLDPATLSTLFQKYGINYHQQVINVARSILKNTAPQFTTTDYYTRRKDISNTFFNALKKGLEEDTHVVLGWFQMRKIGLSPQVSSKLLESLVQGQANQKESFIQNATVIRKETARLAQEALANITVINATAFAQASLILNKATTEAFRITTTAKQIALANMFSQLNITTSQQKLTFLYATGLGSRKDKTKILADIGTTGFLLN